MDVDEAKQQMPVLAVLLKLEWAYQSPKDLLRHRFLKIQIQKIGNRAHESAFLRKPMLPGPGYCSMVLSDH